MTHPLRQAMIEAANQRSLDLRPMSRSFPVDRVRIRYVPREVFHSYHRRQCRFAHIVAHRRCGKTVAAVNEDVRKILTVKREFPVPQVAFISPTYAMGKRNAWEYAKWYTKPIPNMKISEQDLTLIFPNGGKYIFIGSDNYGSLRGMYQDHATFDEFALQNPLVWTSVVRPSLSDFKGTATFIGSANGRNHFYDIKKKHLTDPEWAFWDLRASQTHILSQEELDSAKRDMPEEQYLQEYENNFDAAVIGSYYGTLVADIENQDRYVHLIHDPTLDTFISFDLGIGDTTAIWVWQVLGNEWRYIDYYENSGQALPHYVDWIKSNRYKPREVFLPHDGAAREQITGMTRQEFLQDRAEFNVTVVPKYSVDDGIHAVRSILPRCFFNSSKCEQGLDCLRMYRKQFDEDKKTWLDKPFHDWASHGADAFRIGVMGLFDYKPSVKPKTIELTLDKTSDMWMYA